MRCFLKAISQYPSGPLSQRHASIPGSDLVVSDGVDILRFLSHVLLSLSLKSSLMRLEVALNGIGSDLPWDSPSLSLGSCLDVLCSKTSPVAHTSPL